MFNYTVKPYVLGGNSGSLDGNDAVLMKQRCDELQHHSVLAELVGQHGDGRIIFRSAGRAHFDYSLEHIVDPTAGFW